MKSKFRLILTFIVIAAVCLNAAPYMAQASPEETREKIEAAEKEKQETEQRIEDTNDDLDAASAKQLSLKQDLNALNSDLETISAHLDDLENQISVKEQEISDT